MKEYVIKDIQDLVDIVTEENKENLLQDISNLFDQVAAMKSLLKEYNKGDMELREMTWVDDGKNDYNSTLVAEEHELKMSIKQKPKNDEK